MTTVEVKSFGEDELSAHTRDLLFCVLSIEHVNGELVGRATGQKFDNFGNWTQIQRQIECQIARIKWTVVSIVTAVDSISTA